MEGGGRTDKEWGIEQEEKEIDEDTFRNSVLAFRGLLEVYQEQNNQVTLFMIIAEFFACFYNFFPHGSY